MKEACNVLNSIANGCFEREINVSFQNASLIRISALVKPSQYVVLRESAYWFVIQQY